MKALSFAIALALAGVASSASAAPSTGLANPLDHVHYTLVLFVVGTGMTSASVFGKSACEAAGNAFDEKHWKCIPTPVDNDEVELIRQNDLIKSLSK